MLLPLTRPSLGSLPWPSLFDEMFGRLPLEAPRDLDTGRFPALNVWADEDALHVEAEVPGLAMDALDLSVLGDELTIKGERPDITEEGTTYHRRERGVGAFHRVLRLPFAVEADEVEATLENGVLTLRLPKAAEARPRRIEVRSA